MNNLLSLALLAALSCPACAAEPAKQAENEPAVRVYFARMDKNADQKIQLPEFQSVVEAQFMIMDADKDGYVTKAEYVQYFCGKPKVGAKAEVKDATAALVAERYNLGQCVAVRTAKYDTADAKKDGKVTKAEAKAATNMDFRNADTDKSGTLTITEWEGLFALYQGKGCDCKPGEPCPCREEAAKLPPTERALGKTTAAKAEHKCEKPCACKKEAAKPAAPKPAAAQKGFGSCDAKAESCECPKPAAENTSPRIPTESMK